MSEMDEPAEPAASVLTTPEEWRDFLGKYDELYLRTQASDQEVADLLDEDEFEMLEEEERLERWLGEEPASEAAVVAAEERLGVRFPPSLRGFLLASNGWMRVNGWVELVHPSERILWMRDSDAGQSLIPLYSETDDYEDLVELFRRSIEVASGEDVWLLDPTDIGPDGEWAACLFTPKYGDLEEFSSFSALFRDGYEDML